MNLSGVLDTVARTLDYPGLTQYAFAEKQQEVAQLLRRQRVLVVLDNFETVTDGALLSWLQKLPEPSKALVTTREYRREFRRNRKIALSLADKKQVRYVQLGSLVLEQHSTRKVYLEGVNFFLLLVKQVFVNEDRSSGVLYLVTSNSRITWDDITIIYRKRWNAKPYHKSWKQNASLERSLTHTVITQTNHFFAALDGYIKLERLKVKTKLNHFALKGKLYAEALRSAFDALKRIQAAPAAQ